MFFAPLWCAFFSHSAKNSARKKIVNYFSQCIQKFTLIYFDAKKSIY